MMDGFFRNAIAVRPCWVLAMITANFSVNRTFDEILAETNFFEH